MVAEQSRCAICLLAYLHLRWKKELANTVIIGWNTVIDWNVLDQDQKPVTITSLNQPQDLATGRTLRS